MAADYTVDQTWVAATATFNYMMKDPLLDWLTHHSTTKSTGRARSVPRLIPAPADPQNFTSHILQQGVQFERKVLKLLIKKFGRDRVVEIKGETAPRDPAKVAATVAAMKAGIPFIHSAVLHNPTNQTFGIPDLLVRSDWLQHLVATPPLDAKTAAQSAVRLGKVPWHYRIVDIKFTSLALRANGRTLLNSGTFPAYKVQLLIYNWALSRLQGRAAQQVYLLGRRWYYTQRGQTYSNDDCFDRLGVIDYGAEDREYLLQAKRAIAWAKEVRTDTAAAWNIYDYPLPRWELYPNMCNRYDYPWRPVKEELAQRNHELTSLWMIGPKNRQLALAEEVYHWDDPNCCAEVLGITGKKTAHILDAIIAINQDEEATVLPKVVQGNFGTWKYRPTVEFFVDFETCNGAMTGVRRLPKANTDNLIFMIGVGYVDPESGEWVYRDFTASRLTIEEEGRICRQFSRFVTETAARLGEAEPRCIHWSAAEETVWESLGERHDVDEWTTWVWLDLLKVFKEEPIVIHGCLSFGLKAVAKALHELGLIKTIWDQGGECVDGQGAMVAAHRASVEARKRGISMRRLPIIKQVVKYNQVDVKVLQEIIEYLRGHHTGSRKRKRGSAEGGRKRQKR